MGILLLLVGLLGLVSGALKLRIRRGTRAARSTFAVAEVLAGATTVIGAGVGLARARPLAWVVVAGVMTLIAVSASAQVRQAVRYKRAREESEGERLRNYLRTRGTPLS